MGSALATELQKYYTRKGNRLIFSNGMTLNRLALAMWERLGYKGVDPSVVSRVIRGERIFTRNQLGVFARILWLKKSEKEYIEEILYQEISNKFGFNEEFFRPRYKYFFDSVQDSLEKIRRVNQSGLPVLAEEWAEQLHEAIIKEFDHSNNSKRKKILKLESELLVERIHLNIRTKPKNTLLRNNIHLAKRLRRISHEIMDETLSRKADYGIGDTLYVVDKYKDSLRYLKSAIEGKVPERVRFGSLRSLALSFSYLDKKTEYESVKKCLIDKISDSPDYIKYKIYEGLARAESSFEHQKTAYEFLFLAKKFLSKNHDYIREIQLINAEIELGRIFGTSRNYLKTIGKKAMNLAKRLGHVRYQEKLRTFLNQK